MKKIAFLMLCCGLICASCAVDGKKILSKYTSTVTESDNIIEKTFNVESFDEIDVSGHMNVKFIQTTGERKVDVKCADNIMDLLVIKVKDDALLIKFKNGVNVRCKTLDITVHGPKLEEVHLAGSGQIDLSEGLKTNDLSCSLSGSGKIEGMNIVCHEADFKVAGSGRILMAKLLTSEVETDISGSGEAALSGTTDKVEFNISGSGEINAVALEAKWGSANISGSGKIKCNVKNLQQSTAGSGKVTNEYVSVQ